MNKIKEKRLEKGISRAELSRNTGIPLRTLESWEAEIRKPTKYQNLVLLAKALECNIDDLI